ncbi:MAG TPA: ABC transporter ATP-binding protein [Microbacteriaceae bacterium]|jgi:simple sugar transport system ATP-binding protein|nr:ABC transporter ATP-binding protein [Microbacteriaceae bacterium]
MSEQSVPILRVEGFTKHFAEVKANTDVHLDVRAGEVHALVGENGAGKSTLLKMIYGVYRPDAGRMLIDSTPVTPGSPAEARALGIGMVFQDLRLVPALTVAENVALSIPRGPMLNLRRVIREITAESEKHGLSVNPRALVQHLSIGERQRLEILKVLMTGARLVILDEPTSVLAPQEVSALFGVVAHLRDQGFGILIVTHKLNEVRAIADRVTVLRAGNTVLVGVEPADYTNDQLIESMVGRAVPPLVAERVTVAKGEGSEPALRISGVRSKGDHGHEALKGVSIDVYPGELVGIAGVAGSGQRELCEVALGLRATTTGTVSICGVPSRTPASAIRAGAVNVPEDPVADSVVARLSVLEHMALDGRALPRKRLGIDWAAVRTRTHALNEALGLRIAPHHRRVSELSGGNIQRVVLTRELGIHSSLVVAAYPSRGLDVANVRRTQEILLDRRSSGSGVLVVSEDLDELMSLADRIVVMHDGHISGEVSANAFDRQHIGRLMLGGAA